MRRKVVTTPDSPDPRRVSRRQLHAGTRAGASAVIGGWLAVATPVPTPAKVGMIDQSHAVYAELDGCRGERPSTPGNR